MLSIFVYAFLKLFAPFTLKKLLAYLIVLEKYVNAKKVNIIRF